MNEFSESVLLPRSIKVTPMSSELAVATLKSMVKERKSGYSLALNAEKIIRLYEEKSFDAVFKGAAICVCDGVGLNLFSEKKFSKVNFPVDVLEACQESGMSLGIIGGTENVARSAASNLRANYNLNILFSCDGYQSDQYYIDLISQHGPDVVLLGLGSPKQEYLALELCERSTSFFVNVGGALNVFAGNVSRAPRFVIHSNFEWLYRLATQPKRIRRYIKLFKIFYVRVRQVWQ